MSAQNTEIFQFVFNSQGSNVMSPTGTPAQRASITYNVNWGALLPDKYNRFNCQFVFKSINYTPGGPGNGFLVDNGFLSMNLGKMNVYDGLQQSYNLGIVYPVIGSTTAGAQTSYYNSTNNDNNNFTICYPNNNTVTLNLNTFAGVAMGNMPHYSVILNVVGFIV
jgi:hypothetical protein